MALLDGKVAIVTGGGSRIGQATCQFFGRQGAKVVVSDIDEKGSKQTIQSIKDGSGEAIFIHADVSKPEDCQALVEATLENFGKLDIAFNNPGIGGASNPTADYSLQDWQKVIGVNLSSIFYCMKYEIPAMLKAGGGVIVNMASILGQISFENSPAYVAAKHGVLGLTKNAALEYSKQGIRVNSIGPGFIRTPLISDLEENTQVQEYLISLQPVGSLIEEEVADLVVWLSSDRASFVTGAYYAIDGGYLVQ